MDNNRSDKNDQLFGGDELFCFAKYEILVKNLPEELQGTSKNKDPLREN